MAAFIAAPLCGCFAHRNSPFRACTNRHSARNAAVRTVWAVCDEAAGRTLGHTRQVWQRLHRLPPPRPAYRHLGAVSLRADAARFVTSAPSREHTCHAAVGNRHGGHFPAARIVFTSPICYDFSPLAKRCAGDVTRLGCTLHRHPLRRSCYPYQPRSILRDFLSVIPLYLPAGRNPGLDYSPIFPAASRLRLGFSPWAVPPVRVWR